MKTLLYIDPFSEFGHVNLNRSYIRTLMDRGFKVRLVLAQGYVRELGFPEEMVEFAFQKRTSKMGLGRLRSRWNLWMTCRLIVASLDLNRYDIVFFSAYEEISLWLAGIRRSVYLVNHANVSGMDNFIKRFFIRRLSRRANHIVLQKFIEERFASFGIDRISVEPQGLINPYTLDAPVLKALLRSLDARIGSEDYDSVMFCSTGSKYDSPLFSSFLADPGFLAYLERTRTLLVVKDGQLECSHSNVVILRGLLDYQKYQAIFMRSDLILICYPESFNYRISACMYECFSNSRPCLVSDIEGFRFFAPHFNYDPFFRNADSLMRAMEAWRKHRVRIAAEPYRDLHLQVPTFASLAAANPDLVKA